MTLFWGKLFLINFTLGVITGIVQEFQFGMNWSAYSRFVGDVFGSPLAIEALAAFFLESTFFGIWLFGWEQLPKGVHLAAIWLVVLGSYLSAFWILIANAFMQEPVGYSIHHGRAEMTSFFALLTNPTLWVEFPHVVAAGIVTGAFFVIGISAYHLLKKKKDQDLFQRAMNIGLIVAVIGSITVIYVGDLQAKHLVQSQPMKLAAAEALWNSENPAALSLFSIPDQQHHTNTIEISLPYGLSFLAHDSLHGEVRGINQLASVPSKPRSLQFQDVSVSYHLPDGKCQPALQSVSFSMQVGKKVVLVGPTVAGKSTMAHLLVRFLEPEEGTICLDGVPLHCFPVEQWRNQVAWQPQRPMLFDVTVTENIRLGRPDATLDEVIRAARQACIHDEIQALPQGYDTVIGERGARLSGGQIQRVSLARALLKNASILVLDEATSTLDAERETQVLRTIETLAFDRIVLMIAHRLNIIRTADQIIVLHEGKVIDVGSHDALLHRCTIYQELMSAYADEEVLV